MDIQSRVGLMLTELEHLLASPRLPFDARLRSALPTAPGIYVISSNAGEILRAGKTKGKEGLRQRVYKNHSMDHHAGNLLGQLTTAGVGASIQDSKAWLKANGEVRIRVIEDDAERAWAEHFMLAVLRPRFSDGLAASPTYSTS